MDLTPWILLLSLFTSSQPNVPSPTSPDANLCNGVVVSYTYSTGKQIKPNGTKDQQPYRFESEIMVLNNGREELKSWRVFVGFAHREILVSANNAVLSGGSSLPVSVENGTIFAATDLKSAIMTAGDVTQMQARVELVGTQFGVAPPLPKNITLVNDGWSCPKATRRGKNVLQVCCKPDLKNKTVAIGEKFLPRQQGDLYDVTNVKKDEYTAQVTIENHNPLGRLDNWNLSFASMKDEVISTTKGASPSIIDSSECINGPQGMDFSSVLSCARRPYIIDLPSTKYNDSGIPFCCRNGTIDPTKSKSVQVYKMPPDLNLSAQGNLNPDYKCGPPVRVSQSQFPDPNNRTAFASWQVICNITQPPTPKCCVSFNDSIIPCNTGGCSSNRVTRACSTTSPALLLPSNALLIPFENRTELATEYAKIKHWKIPHLMPCGDNCGVSINCHLATEWSAHVTLFNWGEIDFEDWFTALGFDKAYSFNGTTIAVNGKINNTIFMKGLPGLNYLVGENPSKDFRVPGKQQSFFTFTKKRTPGIKVGSGDGFPTKVFFNGQECSLPSALPSNGHRRHISNFLLMALPFLALSILMVTGGEISEAIEEIASDASQEIVVDIQSPPRCRMCLEEGKLMELGCLCKGELTLAHKECATKWFAMKTNTICEICKTRATNVKINAGRPSWRILFIFYFSAFFIFIIFGLLLFLVFYYHMVGNGL